MNYHSLLITIVALLLLGCSLSEESTYSVLDDPPTTFLRGVEITSSFTSRAWKTAAENMVIENSDTAVDRYGAGPWRITMTNGKHTIDANRNYTRGCDINLKRINSNGMHWRNTRCEKEQWITAVNISQNIESAAHLAAMAAEGIASIRVTATLDFSYLPSFQPSYLRTNDGENGYFSMRMYGCAQTAEGDLWRARHGTDYSSTWYNADGQLSFVATLPITEHCNRDLKFRAMLSAGEIQLRSLTYALLR